MTVRAKDALKLVGILIISCCAVFVCTMFLNYSMDIVCIRDKIVSEQAALLYDAQVLSGKVTCLVSGGCLLLTAVIMLIFYIKHYIDIHKKDIGILKALGYSNIKIAKDFSVFGLSVFAGAAVGLCGAYIIMPTFYSVQNEDGLLPEVAVHFHPVLVLCLVVLPAAVFALLSVIYACIKLKAPVLMLIRDSLYARQRARKHKGGSGDGSFLSELKRSTLREKKTLVFFIAFSAFCFSAMTQMSASMKDLSSALMGAIILLIGIILACTTLFLAITTVINGNTKVISMMRIFGYSQKECCSSLLGVYRPVGYIGFAVGTVYQYALLKIMVTVVFRDIDAVPEYNFDISAMLISLAAFIFIYELVMYFYSGKIKKVSVKEIMIE